MRKDSELKFLNYIEKEQIKLNEYITALRKASDEGASLRFNDLKWLMGALWGINKTLSRNHPPVGIKVKDAK
jgi:hypothetical protein